MNSELIQPISREAIEQYEADGVVCIRGQFDQDWVNLMRDACVGTMNNPKAKSREVDDADDPGYYFVSSHMARQDEIFHRFVIESPAAEIAARVMQLDEVRFFYDQLFIKDPGTRAPTPWHNDQPFWNFAGANIASVWLALTPVSAATSGLVYVAGSHRWNKLYRAITPDYDEAFLDESLELCPQFHDEFDNPAYRFLSWDMEPGDVLVHHPMVVHGSGRNDSTDQRRVALSCRYFGGDAIWTERKTGFRVPGANRSPYIVFGQPPRDDTVFPIAWQSQGR
jgi:ectoine hydroxylase-related dioxygenase (phytanoyl-CoA dioxygenase family)